MKIKNLIATSACLILSTLSYAQLTCTELEILSVNENVTTVITSPEKIKFVDISTDKIVGDQPIDNVVRFKPKSHEQTFQDGNIIAIATIVTERHKVQYGLRYVSTLQDAVTDKTIHYSETTPYNNPAVSMSTAEMAIFSRRIWNSPARYRDIGTRQNRMYMRINNIYSIGEYFFLDFSIQNHTNIRFDIDQIRVKMDDKRRMKSTNSQSVELRPSFILDQSESFMHGYRNVLVLKKLTFPNDKILTIEVTEKQISGRTISLNIEYEEVLAADTFNETLLDEF